jgi:PAS domain S-box-containing protein
MLQGEDSDPSVIDHLRTCLKEARFFVGTTTNYRKDGSPYMVRWNISPVHDDEGVLTHFVSVQQDISDIGHALETLFKLLQGRAKRKRAAKTP